MDRQVEEKQCKYFRTSDDDKIKIDSQLCSAKLSRGGVKNSSFNSISLIRTNRAEFKESANATSGTGQQSLKNWEKMSSVDRQSVKITKAFTLLLMTNVLSVGDNRGFPHVLSIQEPNYEIPSCPHITETVPPKLHGFVKKHINTVLQDISAFSFTTDIWTSSVRS